jgi:metal-responsive CopG/Arc/MetJ family transcriptional regulator
LTLNHTYDLPPRVGRKKEFPNRITLPLSDEMLAGIDEALRDDEARLGLIRTAIERELKRREREKKG